MTTRARAIHLKHQQQPLLCKSRIEAPTGAVGIRLFIRLFKIRLNSPNKNTHQLQQKVQHYWPLFQGRLVEPQHKRSRSWCHPQLAILLKQVIRSAGCYLYQNQKGLLSVLSGGWQSSFGWKRPNMTNHLVHCQHVKLTNREPQIYVEHTFSAKNFFVWSIFTNVAQPQWLVKGFR